MPNGPIDLRAVNRKHAEFKSALAKEVEQVLAASGDLAQDHVRLHSTFKRQTGSPRSLKDATKYRVVRITGGRRIFIRSEKHTAQFLEYGTRAHGPKRARFLVFRIKGRLIRTKWVRGIRPYKFLWKATWAAYRQAGYSLQTRLAWIAKKF